MRWNLAKLRWNGRKLTELRHKLKGQLWFLRSMSSVQPIWKQGGKAAAPGLDLSPNLTGLRSPNSLESKVRTSWQCPLAGPCGRVWTGACKFWLNVWKMSDSMQTHNRACANSSREMAPLPSLSILLNRSPPATLHNTRSKWVRSSPNSNAETSPLHGWQLYTFKDMNPHGLSQNWQL